MQVSAEIRWFWEDEGPEGLKAWFLGTTESRPAPGGGTLPPRIDTYLYDGSTIELGIKQRGKPGGGSLDIEVKGLVEKEHVELHAAPIAGMAELWTKWTSKALDLRGFRTVVEKQRWLRKYDTSAGVPEIPLGPDENPIDGRALPAVGCNVELTRVVVGGKAWWTLGLESFGGVKEVGPSLTRTAEALVRAGIPSWDKRLPLSYPAWLIGSAQGQVP